MVRTWWLEGFMDMSLGSGMGGLSSTGICPLRAIHEKLIKLGYTVYGFGEHESEVTVHYRRRREDKGMRIYRFRVDDRCPRCGWRVSSAYVLASSEDEAKSLVGEAIRLCGNCMADMLVDRVILSSKVKRSAYAPQKPRASCLIISDL